MLKSFIEKRECELLVFAFLLIKMLWLAESIRFNFTKLFAALLCGFISIILGKVIRSIDENNRNTAYVFIIFFLASSVSNSVLFLDNLNKSQYINRNTLFIFCLLLIFILICDKQLKWWIPLICFVCAALHPLSLFLLLPALSILIFYHIGTSASGKWFPIACILSVLSACLLFGRNKGLLINTIFPEPWNTEWRLILAGLIVTIPIVGIFTALWVHAAKQDNSKSAKAVFILVLLLPAVSVILLAANQMNINPVMYGLFLQYCFYFYFFQIKDEAFMRSIRIQNKYFGRIGLPVLLTIIYLSSFSIGKKLLWFDILFWL